MLLKQALSAAVARLSDDHVPSPRLNAELLLRFILNCDRAYLFAHPERELSVEEQAGYSTALNERARGVPTQYITGHQEFWGMDLIVTPAVLIPRPETEHVIEAVIAIQTTGGGRQPSALGPRNSDIGRDPLAGVRRPTADVRIIDVGTGSGCIALALAQEFPQAAVHASDISADALEIARANAARHQLENRIDFRQTDLLEGLNFGDLDFVVSNPPYVGDSEADQVQLDVRKFEPRQAVFAGPTGLEVIARLIPQAHAALRPGGWLVMEISGTICSAVNDLLTEWQNVAILPDLQSIPRVVQAQKAPDVIGE